MAKWSLDELNDYRSRAEADDVETQIYLGWSYFKGEHVEKNDDLAKKWLERASHQGSKEATYRLAMFLISRKDRDGIKMLTELSAENFPPAAYELGNYYYVGFLVERDVSAAAREWAHAADSGHAIARIKLLKYQKLHSPFYMKPFFFVKIVWAGLSALSILLRDMHDHRVLGSLK